MNEQLIQQAAESLEAIERERAPPSDEEFDGVFAEVESFFKRFRQLRNPFIDRTDVSELVSKNMLEYFSQNPGIKYKAAKIDYAQCRTSEGLTPDTFCDYTRVNLSGDEIHVGLRLMYAGRGRLEGTTYLDLEEEYPESLRVIEIASSPDRKYCFIRYCEEVHTKPLFAVECIYTQNYGRHPEGYIPSTLKDDWRMEEVDEETAMFFVNRLMNKQLNLPNVEQEISDIVQREIVRK